MKSNRIRAYYIFVFSIAIFLYSCTTSASVPQTVAPQYPELLATPVVIGTAETIPIIGTPETTATVVAEPPQEPTHSPTSSYAYWLPVPAATYDLTPFQPQWIIYKSDNPAGYFAVSLDGEATISYPPYPSDLPRGIDRRPLVSPNGRYALWYSTGTENLSDFAIIRIDAATGTGHTILAQGNISEFPEYPVWSPDGHQIAYLIVEIIRDSDSIQYRRSLWIADVETGTARLISTNESISNIETLGGRPKVFIWHTDGYIYISSSDGILGVNSISGDVFQVSESYTSYNEQDFLSFLRQSVPQNSVVSFLPGDQALISPDGQMRASIEQGSLTLGTDDKPEVVLVVYDDEKPANIEILGWAVSP